MKKNLAHLLKAALTFAVATALALALCACGSSGYKTGAENSGKTSATANTGTGTSGKTSSPTYEDPRWPTINLQLLHTPEENRWYNTKNHLGEIAASCVGPVVSVEYRPDVNGQPTYIDIGKKYPSSEGVTLIIWGTDRATFSDDLSRIKVGSWIDAGGEPYLYNGRVYIKCEFYGQIFVVE